MNNKAKFSAIYSLLQTIISMVVLSAILIADNISDISMFAAVAIGCLVAFPICWGSNYIYTAITNWILERTSK